MGHVHFAERTPGGPYLNPLRPGALVPFMKHQPPEVDRILAERNGHPLDPNALTGIVDLIEEAHDVTPIPPLAPLPDRPPAGQLPRSRPWFLARVRCLTSCARAEIRRRRIRVCSSGSHTAGRKPPASSLASVRASILSVFAPARVIPLTAFGFASTTRATCGSMIRAIPVLLHESGRVSGSFDLRV